MIENVNYVSRDQVKDILRFLKNNPDIFIAEIHGKNIRNEQELIYTLNRIFGFPLPYLELKEYLGWLKKIDWLDKEEYTIIIYDYCDFMIDDIPLRREILNFFKSEIIPWWQDSLQEKKDDSPVPFLLYLVK